MLDSAQPIPLDYQLPADAYWHLIRSLHLILPPPPTDSPEDLLRRDHAAMARIAAFAPGDSTEADVAAEYVAASEQWKDCLRLVREPGITREWAMKCRAQALCMMRQADRSLRLLRQLQAERRREQADKNACQRRDWTEHCATAAMAEALQDFHPDSSSSSVSPAQAGAHPAAGSAAPWTPASAGETAPLSPADQNPAPAEQPSEAPAETGPIAEAEFYAALYPERAALIRRLGRMPLNATFDPPDDDIVAALVTANTPALAALDRVSESRAA
jgi:hypothetical protein